MNQNSKSLNDLNLTLLNYIDELRIGVKDIINYGILVQCHCHAPLTLQ